MAKTDNLTDFLTGVADAIRTKKGTMAKINPQNFETEIASITTSKPEQEKTAALSMLSGDQIISPDSDKVLSKVTITKPDTLTPENIKRDTNIGGVIGILEEAKPEQEKTTDLSMLSGNQIISPDSGKVLSKVTITKPATLTPENIKKDTNIGGVVGTLEEAKPEQEKPITITTNGSQMVTPDEGKVLSKVTITTNVPATPTEEKTVELALANGNQVLTPTAGKNFSKVTIMKPTTLTSENIRKSVVIGGVTGSLEERKAEQEKTTTITTNSTVDITPDTDKVLSKVSVTVNVAGKEEQEKTVDLAMATGDQVVTPDSGKTLSSVTITRPSTFIADNIRNGTTIGGIVGTLEPAKAEETRTVSLNMSTGDQNITPSATGKVMTKVTVERPSTFYPINIKKGVNIAGVVGTLEERLPEQEKTINITQNGTIEVTADTTTDIPERVLSKVTINTNVLGDVTSYQEKSTTILTNGTTEITPDVGKLLSKVTVTTNVAPKLDIKTVTPSKDSQVVKPSTGYDGLSQVTVNAIPGEYIIPTGTLDIYENGSYDVTEKDSVNVNISAVSVTTNLLTQNTAPTDTTNKLWVDYLNDGSSSMSINSSITTDDLLAVTDSADISLPEALQNGVRATIIGDIIYMLPSSTATNQIYTFNLTSKQGDYLSTTLSESVSNPVIASVGNVLYIISGTTIVAFDVSHETENAFSETLTYEATGGACAVYQDKIYLIGGDNIDNIVVIDTSNVTVEEVYTGLSYAHGISAAVYENKIYLFGGEENGLFYENIRVFDPSTNQFESDLEAKMIEKVYKPAVATANGCIYVFGGNYTPFRYSGASNIIQCLDMQNTIMRHMGVALTSSSYSASAVVYNNTVYLLGAADETYHTAMEFTPPTSTLWTETQTVNLMPARYGGTYFLLLTTPQVSMDLASVYADKDGLAVPLAALTFDGTNWKDIYNKHIYLKKLYAPTISISGSTLTINHQYNNESNVGSYEIYNKLQLVHTVTPTTPTSNVTVDLATLSLSGQCSITVKAISGHQTNYPEVAYCDDSFQSRAVSYTA